ncbi:MAG: ESPR domain-containing protein [Neisseria sp.]|nr:ESPR domain-containing protein [Neisseria sp.]
MNRTLYKVVFNKHRNSMMAVAENAKREGKNTADTQAVGILPNDISGFAGFIHSISVISLDLLRKYSSHCINQPRNQICP